MRGTLQNPALKFGRDITKYPGETPESLPGFHLEDTPKFPPLGVTPKTPPQALYRSLPGLALLLLHEGGKATELRHPRVLLHPAAFAPGLGTWRGVTHRVEQTAKSCTPKPARFPPCPGPAWGSPGRASSGTPPPVVLQGGTG